jgi:hypothetical protein
VRLRRNPTHYKLKEGANQEDEDELLRQIHSLEADVVPSHSVAKLGRRKALCFNQTAFSKKIDILLTNLAK